MNLSRQAAAPKPAPRLHRITGPAGVAGLVALVLVSACRQEPAPTAARPLGANELARVGPAVISVGSFLAERARQGGAVSDAELLGRLTRRELLFAEAQRTGFDRSPEIQATWKAMVAARFEEAQLPPSWPDAAVSEAEAARYHGEHAARYTTPEQVHAAVLQLHLPASAPELRRQEVLARAEALRKSADGARGGPEAFAALAREHSQHAGSRRNGGDLGWLTRAGAAQFLPAEVVVQLFVGGAPCEISPVLTTAEGLFLVQILERRPAQVRPLEEVRERVRRDFAVAQAAAAEAELFGRLRAQHPVELNSARLAELARPAAGSALASHPPRLPAP